jgi:hypothetical protein
MRHDRDRLLRLAANRRRRLDAAGRPSFGLTREEAESSALTAMRLAEASKSQIAARSPELLAHS